MTERFLDTEAFYIAEQGGQARDNMNFYVTGLPRSRTTWLATVFLAHGYMCWHEAMNNCSTKDDFISKMSVGGLVGNSDCGLPYCDVLASVPGPIVIVKRDVESVQVSLATVGIFISTEVLHKMNAKLDTLSGLVVAYEDIDSRIDDIFMHCVGVKTNPTIMAVLSNIKAEPLRIVATATCWEI